MEGRLFVQIEKLYAQQEEQIRQQVHEVEELVSFYFVFLTFISVLQVKQGQINIEELSIKGRKKSKDRSQSYDKKRGMKSRFIAADLVRDVKNGKLPFKTDNERIAKYGQGFSNILQLV